MAGYCALACRMLIGIVFAASAFSKLRSKTEYRAFARWLGQLPLPGPLRGAPAAAAAVAASSPAPAPGGIALALAVAVTAAVPTVLFDDLLSIFRLPASGLRA